MKIIAVALLSLVVIEAPLPVRAEGTSPVGTEKSPDLTALEQFLNLSDTELAQMADAIARVRAMTPAQKEQLRKEIVAFRQLPAQQRQQLRQGWGWVPADIQNGWREMMQNATPERRAAIQTKMQSLGPAEKAEYRRQLVEDFLKQKGK